MLGSARAEAFSYSAV